MTCECGKECEPGRDSCFRCRVSGVGFSFKGSVQPGRKGWNQTKSEWMKENLGTTDERALAARGIERADKV